MAVFDKYLKHEQRLRYFEGWVSSNEMTKKDDGTCYVSFSIPLKQNKDDEPDWLNCRIYGTEFAVRFFNDCPKGTKIGIWGLFNIKEGQDGKTYCNFIVKNYVLYEKRQPKAEG